MNTPPYPDLGEHLWKLTPQAQLVFMNCFPYTLSNSPDNEMELSFVIDMDEQRFAGTVQTQQTRGEVLEIIKGADGGCVIVEGRLSPETVTGLSGEVFRLIIGEVSAL